MSDYKIAIELEKQILGDRYFLGCGCIINKICTHPNEKAVLLDEDIELCELHTKHPRQAWLGMTYGDSGGKRKVWVHKEDGEIVSYGWWYNNTEYWPGADKNGCMESSEGTHLIGKRTGMANRLSRTQVSISSDVLGDENDK